MEYSKTIYKLDSAKKLRFLRVRTNGATLIQESGVVGSENIVTHESVCVAKNVGRSNETKPEEQAQLEAASKIETKLSTGYFPTKEEAKDGKVILPMLAKEYKKEVKKIDWKGDVYVQPKLDGMRSLGAWKKQMISRKGKPIDTMAHIQAELDSIMVIDVFDGELYAHGKNFQENMRLIKKYRGHETEGVVYHVYDMVYPNLPFIERWTLLNTLLQDMEHINIVPTYKITSEDELKKYHQRFLEHGYEGTMVRHGDAGYAINKRDSQLLKYKDFIDTTCIIKDVIPMEKIPTHGGFIFDWPGATGHPMGDDILGCGMKFSHKEREEMLLNKDDYIGKTAELRFFEYSEEGVPRFPVCVGIRLDK